MKPAQRQAIKIACAVMRALRVKPGQTERQIAAWITQELAARDAKPSFPLIVAAGPRSLDPHARPTNRRLRAGEQVVVDLGAKYRGYCSDLTRTFFIGKPTAKYAALYAMIKEAQRRAIKAVKAGAYCREVDISAREHIKRLCFRSCRISEKLCPGDCFIHTTGHGVGVKIHQHPRISLKSRTRLKAGMVITVEPGIYLPGWGGIRLEDMVLVTRTGCQLLTKGC
ncbi:MAG: M24 family metallopeptidase [Candidatus Margulisiibacteriota bacterium]